MVRDCCSEERLAAADSKKLDYIAIVINHLIDSQSESDKSSDNLSGEFKDHQAKGLVSASASEVSFTLFIVGNYCSAGERPTGPRKHCQGDLLPRAH